MSKVKLLLTWFFTVALLSANATTWDEPWQDQVIKQSDHFILAEVKSVDEYKGITITIIKSLGGSELKGTIQISNFYLLDLCSVSDDKPGFHFEPGDTYYFFIKENDEGGYGIATPTAGFANVADARVMATYRHSYHQASVPAEIYEATMTAIFNHYHGRAYDMTFISGFINKYLHLKPSGFTDQEVETFYLQHVALETIFHLKLHTSATLLAKFLNDTDNIHNQISGARAMCASNDEDATSYLLDALGDPSKTAFVKVMCIWSLEYIKPRQVKSKLELLEQTASTEDDGFGGNIMDPRVCTHIPTEKQALRELIEALEP